MAKDRIRRKLRARMGYNLFETMVTLLILSLMTGGMAAGVRLASEQYRVAMVASESLVLCSTLSDAIKGYLRNAETINVAEGTFDAPSVSEGSSIYVLSPEGEEPEDLLIDGVELPFGEVWIGDKTNSDSNSHRKLINSSSYSSFNLLANATVTYSDSLPKHFHVKLIIVDAVRGSKTAESSFDVFPLN